MARARGTARPESLPKGKSASVGLGLFAALAMIGLLLWGFAVLADEFSEKGRLAQLDVAVLSWLQLHGSESGERVFEFVSWLGAPVLFAVDIAVAAWLAIHRSWRSFALWVVAIAGGAVLDEVLKLSFQRARPSVASEFIHGGSWSFPSGHAMNSLVGYSMLAFLLREHVTNARVRVLIALAAALLIVAIGFSRLYLGVHYLSDVTAGYFAGGAWVLACVTAERYARTRSSRARGWRTRKRRAPR
jgi:membrane-associated phospholipid phosphatase